MTKLRALTLSAMALLLAAGAASADSGTRHGGAGPGGMGWGHDMMEMMMRMHGTMGAGTAMPGMGMMGGGGMPMMGGMQGMAMLDMLDEDGDGTVIAEEARSFLEGLLSDYDSDGDGTLSLSEFETLHSALIRETMVDRFQHLDADGNGQITADEMRAPAERIDQMQAMRERMMQEGGGASGQDMMPGQGSMMDGSSPGMQGQPGN